MAMGTEAAMAFHYLVGYLVVRCWAVCSSKTCERAEIHDKLFFMLGNNKSRKDY
jgi:hypothetical protein